MVYTLIFKSRWLGGDDGMGGLPRFDLSALGLNMNGSLTFALFALGLIALAYGWPAACCGPLSARAGWHSRQQIPG